MSNEILDDIGLCKGIATELPKRFISGDSWEKKGFWDISSSDSAASPKQGKRHD